MSKVINAAPFTMGQDQLTLRTAPLPHQDKTAGTNSTGAAHNFEARVVQEQGTH